MPNARAIVLDVSVPVQKKYTLSLTRCACSNQGGVRSALDGKMSANVRGRLDHSLKHVSGRPLALHAAGTVFACSCCVELAGYPSAAEHAASQTRLQCCSSHVVAPALLSQRSYKTL